MKTNNRTLAARAVRVVLFFFIVVQAADSGPRYSQWRWRNDDGDVYTATWKDSANQPFTYRNEGNIRLRRSLVFFEMTGPTTVTLRYSSDPYFYGTEDSSKWTLITTADTGKFFLSDSRYLIDGLTYSDNQLLPRWDNTHPSTYRGTITVDSSLRFPLLMNSNDGYEFEYCLKTNKNVPEGSVYYFLSVYNRDGWSSLYDADPPCMRFPPFYWKYYKRRTSEPRKIQFVDDLNGWYQSYEDSGFGLRRTSDGGTTWNLVTDHISEYPFHFVTKDTGWAVVDYRFCKTTDGGLSWAPLKYRSDTINNFPYTFYFYNAKCGWAIRESDQMFRTTDGGETWEKTNSPNAYIRSPYFINERVGFVIGENLYKTTDAGASWRLVQSAGVPSMPSYVTGIQFVDSSTGWALRTNGNMVHTIDGGEHWTPLLIPSMSIYSFAFSDRNKGWAVGYQGMILATKDGGVTWEKRPSGTGHHLYSLAAINDHVWIVSDDGTILSSETGGWTAIAEKNELRMPQEFTLFQNYPNPFNPQTTIRYALPKASFVIVKIFDLLGREIETAVNEQKPAGVHEVRWDASRYSSGVYIYRIRAGDHVQARMMALVK